MPQHALKPITILGSGAWGTALALYLARRGQQVRLWSVVNAEITAMLANRTNNQFLPGYPFPETIHPTANLAEAIEGVDDILMVIPSVGFRPTLTMLKPLIKPSMRIICASKGMDEESGLLFNTAVENIIGKQQAYAVLSGPSFAKEVAAGLPTSVVIASHDNQFVKDLSARFNSDIFHIHPSHDVIGVELGGVVKNVIAIATGISDGLNFGSNARCAIITLGLNEIIRLGTALGGKPETFVGLSGVGDLILTASDDQSRNRRLGLAFGKGNNIAQAEKEIGQVVEGKRNAELVVALAKKYHVAMPVCTTVWEMLQGKIAAKEGIKMILAAE